jgi:hypothetical protein
MLGWEWSDLDLDWSTFQNVQALYQLSTGATPAAFQTPGSGASVPVSLATMQQLAAAGGLPNSMALMQQMAAQQQMAVTQQQMVSHQQQQQQQHQQQQQQNQQLVAVSSAANGEYHCAIRSFIFRARSSLTRNVTSLLVDL